MAQGTAVVNWGDQRLTPGFWRNVSPCPITGCWHWTGAVNPYGTPTISSRSARRRAYRLSNPDPGPNNCVIFNCGNSLCVNPAHARLGRKHAEADKRRWTVNRKHTQRLRRENHVRKTYGISPQEHRDMLAAQDGKCAICRLVFENDPRVRKTLPHVDHCHTTGRVRALLCTRCNQGIGMLLEDTAILRSAIAYLERHKSKVSE